MKRFAFAPMPLSTRRLRSLGGPLVLGLALAACADDDLDVIENVPPVAEAAAVPGGLVGEVLTFDGSASSDADGVIKAWQWTFGDGTTAEGEVVSHIFNTAGDYTAELTVLDDGGAAAADQVSFTVASQSPPVAIIEAELAAEVGANLRLDGSGSYDPDGTIALYDWDLGDGATRAGSLVDYAFTAAGTYAVKLTVTDDDGLTDEVLHQVTITEPEVPPTLDGTWQWSLVDPGQYDLGGTCGTFQDSMLQIVVSAPSISITEQAGSISVDYQGSIDMGALSFEAAHNGLLSTQIIRGTFTSMTTFEGEYAIDVDFGPSCATRAVVGVKVP